MYWKNRSAYAFIKTRQGTAEHVWHRFQSWDNIIGAWVVTGEYDVIAWFDAKDWDTIHDCIATIKQWDEVENTKTHMVHNGYKNQNWWWNKPTGAWVMFKENTLDETSQYVPKWDWITSGASIPGDWDYMAWIQADNWDELWHHLMETKQSNYKTTAVLPLKTYWNTAWEQNWWDDYNSYTEQQQQSQYTQDQHQYGQEKNKYTPGQTQYSQHQY